ncbi:hypothetical protein ASG80_00215 [Agromyces sp. Soil535]|nr:hypothetical protein ASG80_00215 [Agromyces sp. Soil535]
MATDAATARRRAVVDHGVEHARRYAALSGPFDPVRALRTIDGVDAIDPAHLTAIAASLSQACDKATTAAGHEWLMRGVQRRRALQSLVRADQVDAAVADRRRTADDQPTIDLLDAIAGEGIFTADAVSAALADASDQSMLERLAVGLGRSGALAPQREQLAKVKAALTRFELLESVGAGERGEARGRDLGRDLELDRITRWLDTAVGDRPSAAMYVDGPAGVGKSTLLESVAASLLGDGDGWVVVRFDFDRAGLDVQDAVGLTMEFARQVSAQVPGAEARIGEVRLQTAGAPSGRSPLKGDTPELVPEELGIELAKALADPPRRILLILDALEVLRARGETHPGRLFDWIDQLAAVARTSIAVIGAGRGDALGRAHARVGEHLTLRGLDEVGADRLLAGLGVDPAAFETIRSVAKGDPLALRLAAAIADEHGLDALAKASRSRDATWAELYRLLLSESGEYDLRRLAAGLLVRHLDADVIREVIAPRVGLGRLTPQRAQHLAQALAGQDWLVEPDPVADGFVRTRPDLRARLLPLLYEAAPARSARIDSSAARWFDARPEPWSAVDAAYHRLQLMRREAAVPTIDPGVLARFDAAATAELPAAAQNVVHRSLGDRSAAFRGTRSAAGAPLDPHAARELRSINDRSDWLEGDYLYDHAFADATLDPKSADADAALTFLWRSGRWSEAKRLSTGQGGWHRDESTPSGAAGRDRLDELCRAELGAEFDFDAMTKALRDETALAERLARMAAEPSLTALTGAGLRFALHRAGVAVGARRAALDAAGVAVECWRPVDPAPAAPDGTGAAAGGAGAGSDGAAPAIVAASPPGWDRIIARTGTVDTGEADPAVIMARSLAVLTPFAELVGTMGSLPGHEHLGEYAATVRERLNDLGNLAPRGSEPLHDYVDTAPSLAVRALTELGLLTELIGAAAYVRRDRDLGLVAQSAERWRRTIAGAWSYGRAGAPPGWDRAVDVTIADRLGALLAESDAIDRATAELEAWGADRLRGDELVGLLRKRSPAAIRAATKAAADGDPTAAAAVLLRRTVPSAFVPGAVVLLGGRRPPGTRRSPRPQHPPRPQRPA